MKTEIHITDVGTGSHATWDGVLTVTQSGGCPVEDILRGCDFSLDAKSLSRSILAAWLDGYDGGLDAARENDLTVEIEREDEIAIARAMRL